jgi:hypothetical protein
LPVITPFEVDIIAIPNPFNTRGISSAPTYLRKPGVLTRCNFLITEDFVSLSYFKAILIVP